MTYRSHTIQRFTLKQVSFERLITSKDSINYRGVTLKLLYTINHIRFMNFFLLKVNETMRVHTITSTQYITLEGTLHLRRVNCVKHHVLTNFQIFEVIGVAKVNYAGIRITRQGVRLDIELHSHII